MEDKTYKEQLEAALLQARKDIAETRSEWKDIAAEMTTTLKKNKRLTEVLQKTVEMFEFAEMVQIGRDQGNSECERISEVISNIQERLERIINSGGIYEVEKPTYLQ